MYRIFCIATLITLANIGTLSAENSVYIVKDGDTLFNVAKTYKTSVEVLSSLNRIEADTQLELGESLLVPSLKAQRVFSGTADKQPPAIVITTAPQNDKSEESIEFASVRAISVSSSLPKETEKIQAARGPRKGINTVKEEARQEQIELAARSSTVINGKAYHIVKAGETLLSIARMTETSVKTLKLLNKLEGDTIFVNETLRIPHSPKINEEYEVLPNDTLSSIALLFKTSPKKLAELNKLPLNSWLKIGQILKVGPKLASSAIIENSADSQEDENKDFIYYLVEKGDTLWSLSRKFNVSTADLERWNPELKNGLKANSSIIIYPPARSDAAPLKRQSSTSNETQALRQNASFTQTREKLSKEEDPKLPAVEQSTALMPPSNKLKKALGDLSSYYSSNIPKLKRQPSPNYFEETGNDPLKNYNKARKLLKEFQDELASLSKVDNKLAGYSIMIDPGHGGLDPGFTSTSYDGDGKPLYIIEDEYNYDISLRLYKKLFLHGARVSLTIISPNHKIIDSEDPSLTFVSQKNEVYNSPFLNQSHNKNSWPIGNAKGLQKRIKVADNFFNGIAKDKTIFVSIHNDLSPKSKDGKMVLYYDDGLSIDEKSREFAKKVSSKLGINSSYRGQNLAVLRNNPAALSILIENRNISYSRNNWAIRYRDLRDEDAAMISNALVEFIE